MPRNGTAKLLFVCLLVFWVGEAPAEPRPLSFTTPVFSMPLWSKIPLPPPWRYPVAKCRLSSAVASLSQSHHIPLAILPPHPLFQLHSVRPGR